MNVEPATIARTIILALALTNQLLTAFGHNVINISDDTINTLIGTIFTIIASITTFWKNNSFTKEAIEADKVLKKLKSAKKE